jgi:serine protease AprX
MSADPLHLLPGEAHDAACPLCGRASSAASLAEAAWLPSGTIDRIAAAHPGWKSEHGGCPACVQQALLETLLREGDEALHAAVQTVWPLDAQAAFGALPTPLRLHADPRYTGRGVTIAFVDAGFYPHRDLTVPSNRIRAFVDAGAAEIVTQRYGTGDVPRWPGWNAGEASQWHGTMTSCAAAGNGARSRGLYRGLASDAEVVLVRVRDAAGRITSASIARALAWIHRHSAELAIRVVSISCAGDAPQTLAHDPVDAAVADLVEAGVVVVAAAGNDGARRLVPPATAPDAITVGGIDDHNTFDDAEVSLWHSNYGETALGAPKPELVAPSLWVVAPLLPGTPEAAEAEELFAERFAGGAGRPRAQVEDEIGRRHLVSPHYQLVEGTSFAAPLVASAAACVIEANPGLTPRLMRDVLESTAHAVPGAPRERQGYGALDEGRAVARALTERHQKRFGGTLGPRVGPDGVVFSLHDHAASRVEVRGSWNDWGEGLPAVSVEPGAWEAKLPHPGSGRHAYKFVLDGIRWLDDPGNPRKAPDGRGGFNSLVDC